MNLMMFLTSVQYRGYNTDLMPLLFIKIIFNNILLVNMNFQKYFSKGLRFFNSCTCEFSEIFFKGIEIFQ